jgi:hypothetical protein
VLIPVSTALTTERQLYVHGLPPYADAGLRDERLIRRVREVEIQETAGCRILRQQARRRGLTPATPAPATSGSTVAVRHR